MLVSFGNDQVNIRPGDLFRDQNRFSPYYPDRFIMITEVRHPFVFAVCVNTLRRVRLEIGSFSPKRTRKGYSKVDLVPHWLKDNLAKIG